MTRSSIVWILAAIVLFGAVAVWVLSGNAAPIEAWVYEQMSDLMNPILDAAMVGITHLCDLISIAVLCLALFAFSRSRRSIGRWFLEDADLVHGRKVRFRELHDDSFDRSLIDESMGCRMCARVI